jgi:hypothetical protein
VTPPPARYDAHAGAGERLDDAAPEAAAAAGHDGRLVA